MREIKISKCGFSVLFLALLLWQLIMSHGVLSQSIVKFLPGFDGPLPFKLETGYIGVDGEEIQLFYYFFESENNPKEDPLLLWITGGPYCSGMSTILYEIGPLQLKEVRYNGSLPKVELRKYSWTKVASILFVDLPVSTGFSYTKTSHVNHSGDLKSSHNVNEFLRKWLENHSGYLSNPLYLGGDSYSGFTLPFYFEEMSNGNEKGMKPFLNLKGYLLGNPATDRSIDSNYQIPFTHGMGLISDEFFESLQRSCKGEYHTIDPTNIECVVNMRLFEWGLFGVEITMVLEDACYVDYLQVRELFKINRRVMSEDNNMLRQLKQLGGYNCRKEGYILARYWMNDKNVQDALHVKKENTGEWLRCKHAFNYSYDIGSSVRYHAKLSAKGFRSLIYSGDHDMIVPFLGTQAWIRSLNYSIIDDWRKWMVDDQVAGFTRTYSNNMTFSTIKGAGHTAPEYKPKQCFAMFKRWMVGEPL